MVFYGLFYLVTLNLWKIKEKFNLLHRIFELFSHGVFVFGTLLNFLLHYSFLYRRKLLNKTLKIQFKTRKFIHSFGKQ